MTLAVDPGAACLVFECLPERPGAAKDQSHVGAAPGDAGKRLDQVLLAGELMEPLHVQHEAVFGDAEIAPHPCPRVGIERLKGRADGGIHDRHALAIQPKLLRALQQLPTVEGDAARPTIRARERIESASAGGSARSQCRTA